MAKKKWFEAGEPLGWSKDLSVSERRKRALKSRGGDALAAGRALQALANVTQDPETKAKAQADAKYFFSLHKRTKGR